MILVTGGAGFIGSYVCESLVKKNKVICADNFNSYYDPKIKEKNIEALQKNRNFLLYRADIRDIASMTKVFNENEIDKVIHIAAMAGVRSSISNPLLYENVNIAGTVNLLELSRKFDIKNFVFASSSSVYGLNKSLPFKETDDVSNQTSPYGATKRAGELFCHNYNHLYGLNITCLRLFTVYGPRCRPDLALYKFVKAIDENKELTMYGDGTSKRDYTYVSDVVAAFLKSLEKKHKFEIINIGSSNTIELKKFIELIETNYGRKAEIVQLPEQPGDIPATFADITKAKELLNWAPKVKVEQGIKNFITWYKNG